MKLDASDAVTTLTSTAIFHEAEIIDNLPLLDDMTSKNEVREWPPVDLIAGLSLKTTAEPELELDKKVLSGKAASCSGQEQRPH